MRAGSPHDIAVAHRTTARCKLARHLARRLERGEHNALWGPRGSGKTTLLHEVLKGLGRRRWALSATTECLDDVTRTIDRAYADIPTKGLTRRTAQARLWRATGLVG